MRGVQCAWNQVIEHKCKSKAGLVDCYVAGCKYKVHPSCGKYAQVETDTAVKDGKWVKDTYACPYHVCRIPARLPPLLMACCFLADTSCCFTGCVGVQFRCDAPGLLRSRQMQPEP